MKTPDNMRGDNHVSLVALAYGDFAARGPSADFEQLGPCGYLESQGEFALRFAREMGPRLQLSCRVELSPETDFSKRLTRIDTDHPNAAVPGWSEATGCDELACYCKGAFGLVSPT